MGTTADDAGNTPDREATPGPVIPDLELTLPSRPENVAVVRHALGGFGDALDVPDQALADIKLARDEVLRFFDRLEVRAVETFQWFCSASGLGDPVRWQPP